MTVDLSAATARRVALAAQGFADPVPAGPPTRAHLKRVLRRTQLLQMDSVNILARAHYLPMFSRLGAYDDQLLNTAAWSSTARAPRLLAEYWAHEAALVPVDDWPLFGFRMREFADGRWKYTREVLQRNRSLSDDVVAVISGSGAMTPRELEAVLGIERPAGEKGSWWSRGEVKHVCEALFACGRLSAVRDDNFTRHYDLAENVLGPDRAHREISEPEAFRALVERAASSHGIATAADLADYYRLKKAQITGPIRDLVDDGTLVEATVEGWSEPAYLHATARLPRRVRRSALLSPFDPLVFFRPRTERLFDFHYRLEIYTPEHKRVHGYYVLPYLLDEQLVARVDLKADRRAGVLQVLAAHCEPGVDHGAVAHALLADLTAMAQWRGLERIEISARGDLSADLRRAQ
ncbi:MAG: crosslink repair DNA glycosylase YcaQ family protein [Gordonia sp. (in: high G+C Gram-positive bacteria)]